MFKTHLALYQNSPQSQAKPQHEVEPRILKLACCSSKKGDEAELRTDLNVQQLIKRFVLPRLTSSAEGSRFYAFVSPRAVNEPPSAPIELVSWANKTGGQSAVRRKQYRLRLRHLRWRPDGLSALGPAVRKQSRENE